MKRSTNDCRRKAGQFMASISGNSEAPTSEGPIDQPSGEEVNTRQLEFAWRLHSSLQGWYATAEKKAQLILTFNGAFVTVLVGSIFGKVAEVQTVVKLFGPETWALLMISLFAPIGAIGCAVACLWSQHGTGKKDLAAFGVNVRDASTYPSAALWYFGHIAHLPAERLEERLRQVSPRTY